jgi:hypothetical protein
MHIAAAFPEWRPQRRDTRAARAFLLPKLSAGAGNIATSFSRRRALPRIGHEIPHGSVNQTLIERRAKNNVRQLDLANLFVLCIAHLDCRHH